MEAQNLDLKKIGKDFKNKVKATVKKIGAVAGDAVFIPIFPFIIGMKKMLKEKGIKHPSDNSGTVKAFYETFVKPKKSFDSQRSNLVEDVFSIVKDIIKFFADAKKRKDAGKADPDDLKAVLIGTKIATTPAPAEPKPSAVSLGSNKNLLIIGGLAVVVIVFVMMKKK
jgi:hypothetical protein